jgi:hypothetical protein
LSTSPEPPDSFLLLDESISSGLATELRGRRPSARTVAELGLSGAGDADLLRAIADRAPGAVLVTTDEHLPGEQAELLRSLGVTVAVVSGRRPEDYDVEAWKREVVHRHAHAMERQAAGTVRSYGLAGSRPWIERRRPLPSGRRPARTPAPLRRPARSRDGGQGRLPLDFVMIGNVEDQLSWRATPYRAPVVDANGQRFGSAESLLGDEEEDIFHGLAVKLSDGGRVAEVSAAHITRITSSAVQTDIPPSEVRSLPPYKEERWYHLGWGGLFRKHPEWKE